MIGIIKISPKGIVSKCGFKYIKFDPKICILPERKKILYNSVEYDYTSDKIYIKFPSSAIIRETMTTITICKCDILNHEHISLFTHNGVIYRSVIFDNKCIDQYPVVNRFTHFTDKYDLTAYSIKNYIKFTTSSVTPQQIEIESSDPSVYSNKQFFISCLMDNHIDIYKYLMQSKECHLPCPVLNQEIANASHLKRFCAKYSILMRNSVGINPYEYKTLDVIDLGSISIFNISDVTFIDFYPVIQITTNNILRVGSGLNTANFCNLVYDEHNRTEDTFLYLVIPDCVSHRIHFNNIEKKSELAVGTDANSKDKHLLLIKHNQKTLERFIMNSVLRNLRD